MNNSYSSNPNQRHIIINRTMPQKGEKKRFLTVYYHNIAAAAQELSEVPFKLYVYLLCNEDKYDLWFSPAAFAKDFGVSAGAARRAVNSLIEAGYVMDLENNKLAFYEEPQKKCSIQVGEQEKRFVPTDEGFVLMTYAEVYTELKENYPTDYIAEFWSGCRREDK